MYTIIRKNTSFVRFDFGPFYAKIRRSKFFEEFHYSIHLRYKSIELKSTNIFSEIVDSISLLCQFYNLEKLDREKLETDMKLLELDLE